MKAKWKFLIIALLAGLPIILSGTAEAQINCGRGGHYCKPGPWGPGGCYTNFRGTTSCRNGQICTDNFQHCAPGRLGPGGCYRSGIRRCDRGQIK